MSGLGTVDTQGEQRVGEPSPPPLTASWLTRECVKGRRGSSGPHTADLKCEEKEKEAGSTIPHGRDWVYATSDRLKSAESAESRGAMPAS